MTFFYILLASFIVTAHAYVDVSNLVNTLPFMGGGAVTQRNNSLVLFGGENAVSNYLSDLYLLTQTPSSYTWQTIPQNNPPPGNIYGQATLSGDEDTLLLIGGMTASTAYKYLPMQMYQYSFRNTSWLPWQGNTNLNTTLPTPPNRMRFSATAGPNNKVYICGGAINMNSILADMWVLDSLSMTFTPLPPLNAPRYAHSASLLSNGKLVILGGIVITPTNETRLASMNMISIYDTTSNTWALQATNHDENGLFASPRTMHTAVVTQDDKIILFGGDNGAGQRTKQFLNSISILDTKTWTWSSPSIKGIPPSRRSYAAGGILDKKRLTVAFGSALNTYYSDINLLDMDEMSWLQSFSETRETSYAGLSSGVIAGVTIAAIVLAVIILFLVWRFWSYVRWLIEKVHKDIWKPRTGEPVWAETTRIVFQIFLLFVFTLFLVFVIKQSIDSPNVTQRIKKPASSVNVPDVRFCFDGYTRYSPEDPRSTGVVCQTNTGTSCTRYIQPLNTSIFQPVFADYLGDVTCYLFRTPYDFQLTETSGANNGSHLIFSFYGDQNTTGRIHVSVYPKEMNPNANVYNLPNDNIPRYLSQSDILNWQNKERNDIQATNVYTIEPFAYSALNYDLIDRRYLQSVGWNYVGFLPLTNSTPLITSNFRQEAVNPNYVASGHPDLGILAIVPNTWAILIDREVKMYTLLNALGFVGGIFGLLIAVQTWLFGYRPRSPWGVVQRWSIGDMKRSLLRGLQSKFKTTDSGIPLVHPVHHRFSVSDFRNLEDETESQRVARVEERMQVLEMLFKAYYVDDEVFRSLESANRASGEDKASSSSRPLFPDSEKVSHRLPLDKGIDTPSTPGFSHMFTRQNSGSSSTYSASQQRLHNQNQGLKMPMDSI
ncbi:hypothetical protein BDF14DRAFT_1788236 [Spinellus fusiger]|nr:hypothetical protein BDF14DRAFT_1788236 [Spinellus fusiger]